MQNRKEVSVSKSCRRAAHLVLHLLAAFYRGSKTAKAYCRRVPYRAWGLTAHRGRASLMLDRRGLVQAPKAPWDQSQQPHARNGYDEETTYDSYMIPEPGFQPDPKNSVDAD